MIGVTTKRKAYERDPWDVAICAWCTNPFDRTKAQADRQQRYCGRKCAGFANAIHHPDEHWRMMARRAAASRRRNRAARLARRLAGKTLLEAYQMGLKDAQDMRGGRRSAA